MNFDRRPDWESGEFRTGDRQHLRVDVDRFDAPYIAVIGNNSSMNQIRYGQISKYGEQRGNVGNKLGDVEFGIFANATRSKLTPACGRARRGFK